MTKIKNFSVVQAWCQVGWKQWAELQSLLPQYNFPKRLLLKEYFASIKLKTNITYFGFLPPGERREDKGWQLWVWNHVIENCACERASRVKTILPPPAPNLASSYYAFIWMKQLPIITPHLRHLPNWTTTVRVHTSSSGWECSQKIARENWPQVVYDLT